jgi:hypothetical protein
VLFTFAWRNLFSTPDSTALALYTTLLFVGFAIAIAGHAFNLLVMGGAARNLVTHLLSGEPVTVRATYSAVRSRFWSLLIATVLVMCWGALSFIVAFIGWYAVVIALTLGSVLFAQVAPTWFSIVAIIAGVLIATVVGLWLFFFMVARVAYVPQVMLVEGRGVLDSIGRSFSLARGNVRRLIAMTLFIAFATYSALMLLVIPLGWYGYLNGIDPSPWASLNWPAWYAIIYSILEPLSSILLTPVWMLGLSLLYVDERVRHEGYDLELMASQRLGKIPDQNVTSPFDTAISLDPRLIPPPPLASSSRILNIR